MKPTWEEWKGVIVAMLAILGAGALSMAFFMWIYWMLK